MKINDNIHGWHIDEVCEIAAVDGTLYMMSHRSGARLAYLDREDECRTFGITFGTLPTDDTGVFHILEHSVLCGSKKFPMKEPFTELLKGSLNTFLNAMTYNDKTTYPVSSRNDKDFYNLVDVYMDAVFNPKAVLCENIFRQEGWRYEIGDDGSLNYNGVVYSEMCGAYSSPDDLADYHNARLMYPGGTYSYDAGGNPDAITSLTYRDFVEAHKTYYRPDNAYLFLDGKPRLDEILPLLDSFLEGFSDEGFVYEVDRGGEPITEPLAVPYELSPGESCENKTRLYINYPALDACELVAGEALSIIRDALADTNEAPLKKRLLDTGLVDDFSLYHASGMRWSTLNLEFLGVRDGKVDELISELDRALSDILREGLDMSLISASLDRREFRLRESDAGSYPKGIAYLFALNDTWAYGIHPRDALDYEPVLRELQAALKTDYYNKLLSRVLGGVRTTLILTPSDTEGERRESELLKKLSAEREALGDEGAQVLRRVSLEFDKWQATPDTKEALATLPSLTLEDLGDDTRRIPTEKTEHLGATILEHPIHTGGITYLECYFDISDATGEETALYSFISSLWKNLDTTVGSANDFRRRAKSALGSITLSTTQMKRGDEPKLYLVLGLSALDRKRDVSLELLREFLFEKKLDNKRAIRQTAAQQKIALTELFTNAGHSFGVSRSAARFSRLDAFREYSTGYEYYTFVKGLEGLSDSELDVLTRRCRELMTRALVRERLTVGVTAEALSDYGMRVAELCPSGEPSGKSKIETLPMINEGLLVPSRVSYAVSAMSLFDKIERRSGVWSTLATMLNFEVLWSEIRVKGGAYGTGFISRGNSGVAAYYSYRDPSPEHSLGVYKRAAKMLRGTLDEDCDLTGYIIGTVGNLSPVTTPSMDGNEATTLYLAGKSYDDVAAEEREVIGTSREELISLCSILTELSGEATFTVVGPYDTLNKMKLDRILEL